LAAYTARIRVTVSSEVATALGAAFVASVLTTIGSRWIAGFQSKNAAAQEQLRRDHERLEARVADERSLRDAKRERLRGDYVAISFAAENIIGASMQLVTMFAGDTAEARAERVQAQLEDATADLGRALTRLKLEEAQAIVDAYQRVRALWFTYQYQAAEADARHDHTEVSETLQKMQAEVGSIITSAKADLDRLGKPI
jgi:hypothetical protein